MSKRERKVAFHEEVEIADKRLKEDDETPREEPSSLSKVTPLPAIASETGRGLEALFPLYKYYSVIRTYSIMRREFSS